MNGFNQETTGDAAGYYLTVPAADVQADRLTPIKIENRAIILTRVDGRIYAVSASCPHAAGDLRYGTLRRGQISCPDHGYRFDVRNGRTTWPEDEVCRLKCYAVKEKEGMVYVKL
jgi:nitrite reductase/ring-hydroxylating ferredoxin subunit